MKFKLFCILLMITFMIKGQDRPWGFKRCVEHAIVNNIELRQLRLAKDNKEIILNTSKYNRLPNLYGGINEDFDFGRSPSKDGTIKDQSATSSYAYLQTSIPVFTGLKIIRDKEAKELDLLAAIEGLNKANEDLTVRILMLYMQILLNKELQHVAQMQVDLCKEQVLRIDKLVKSQKIANSQLYDINAQLAIDEVTLTKAKNNVELSILSLIQLLNIDDVDNSFDIITPQLNGYENNDIESFISPDDIFYYAVNTKPVIKEQEFLLESSYKSLLIAKAGYSPQINLNASFTTYYYHYNGFDNNIPFADQINQNARQTISLTLSVPIFNRFQTRNNIKSARIAILNQELTIEAVKHNLYSEIRQAYANTIASCETLASTTKAVSASKKKFQDTEARFRAEKGTTLEYNESKTNYFQSLSEQTQAKFDYIFRRKILDLYNGEQINL